MGICMVRRAQIRQAAPCLSSLEDLDADPLQVIFLEDSACCMGFDKTMMWCAGVGIICHHQDYQVQDSTAQTCAQCPRGPYNVSIAPQACAEAQQTIHHILC